MKNYISQTKFTNYENDKDLLTLGTQSVQIEDVDITEGSIGTFSGDLNMITPGSKVKLTSPDGLTQSSLELDNTGSLTQDGQSIGAFKPSNVSGATHSLDLSQFNFFDAGELTEDTTVEFVNPPEKAKFEYSFKSVNKPFNIDGSEQISKTIIEGIEDVQLSSDGTKLFYVYDGNGHKIGSYDLTTPFDIETKTNKKEKSIQFSPRGFFIKPDGTKAYVNSSFAINQYTFNTPFDVNTLTYDNIESDEGGSGIHFKSDGSKMYVLDDEEVKQFSLSVPWDVNSLTYDNKSINVDTQLDNAQNLFISEDGSKLFLCDLGGFSGRFPKIFQYTLNTPHDIVTATYDNVEVDVADYFHSIDFNPEGTKFFTAHNDFPSDGFLFSYETEKSTITLPNNIVNPPYINPEIINTFEFFTNDGGTTYNYVESQPEIKKPGIVSGSGEHSIRSSDELTITPAQAIGNCSIALGEGAQAAGRNTIAIGVDSLAIANACNEGIAIGEKSVGGERGIGIGRFANSCKLGIGIGYSANGTRCSLAIGYRACAGGGLESIAIGNIARANQSQISIGTNTRVCCSNGIALGNNITATKQDTLTTRELELCKAGGGLTLTTPDGLNQSKLTIDNSQSLLLDGSSIGGGGGSAGLVSGSDIDSIQTSASLTTVAGNAIGTGSLALGNESETDSSGNIAIGCDSHALGGGGFTRGNISIGTNAFSTNEKSVAIGLNSEGLDRAVVIGANSDAQNRSVSVGRGVVAATNSVSIGEASFSKINASVALGSRARSHCEYSISIGSRSEATTNGAVAIGRQVTASKADTVTTKELETCVPGGGLILTTPDGNNQYKLTINNSGQILTSLV